MDLICEEDIISRLGSGADVDDLASAARPTEEIEFGRHRRRGGNKESSRDEDDVELHYGTTEIPKEQKKWSEWRERTKLIESAGGSCVELSGVARGRERDAREMTLGLGHSRSGSTQAYGNVLATFASLVTSPQCATSKSTTLKRNIRWAAWAGTFPLYVISVHFSSRRLIVN
jgi:hypothetical protein